MSIYDTSMKFGIADYGMNVWYGVCYDTGARLDDLKAIGYDGIERLEAASPSDAVAKAVLFRERGMDFTTVRGPNPEATIRWTAALGKGYTWTHSSSRDLDLFCRQTNAQIQAAGRFGVRIGIHNHLGAAVESQAQLETFLERCPLAGLVLDTGHLAAAGGDPVEIVKKYAARLLVVHVKDWLVKNPGIGLEKWQERGYFTTLGRGNIGQDNALVLKTLRAVGYDGWVFVEHDTHLQDPLLDLKESREYLRRAEA